MRTGLSLLVCEKRNGVLDRPCCWLGQNLQSLYPVSLLSLTGFLTGCNMHGDVGNTRLWTYLDKAGILETPWADKLQVILTK